LLPAMRARPLSRQGGMVRKGGEVAEPQQRSRERLVLLALLDDPDISSLIAGPTMRDQLRNSLDLNYGGIYPVDDHACELISDALGAYKKIRTLLTGTSGDRLDHSLVDIFRNTADKRSDAGLYNNFLEELADITTLSSALFILLENPEVNNGELIAQYVADTQKYAEALDEASSHLRADFLRPPAEGAGSLKNPEENQALTEAKTRMTDIYHRRIGAHPSRSAWQRITEYGLRPVRRANADPAQTIQEANQWEYQREVSLHAGIDWQMELLFLEFNADPASRRIIARMRRELKAERNQLGLEQGITVTRPDKNGAASLRRKRFETFAGGGEVGTMAMEIFTEMDAADAESIAADVEKFDRCTAQIPDDRSFKSDLQRMRADFLEAFIRPSSTNGSFVSRARELATAAAEGAELCLLDQTEVPSDKETRKQRERRKHELQDRLQHAPRLFQMALLTSHTRSTPSFMSGRRSFLPRSHPESEKAPSPAKPFRRLRQTLKPLYDLITYNERFRHEPLKSQVTNVITEVEVFGQKLNALWEMKPQPSEKSLRTLQVAHRRLEKYAVDQFTNPDEDQQEASAETYRGLRDGLCQQFEEIARVTTTQEKISRPQSASLISGTVQKPRDDMGKQKTRRPRIATIADPPPKAVPGKGSPAAQEAPTAAPPSEARRTSPTTPQKYHQIQGHAAQKKQHGITKK
jgi:hypothetical protein